MATLVIMATLQAGTKSTVNSIVET